jgi:enediyne biosynthesis protein E4
VALLDYDHNGWPGLIVANDTQPNKLYRNLRNGTFEDCAVRAGIAFSEDGKARAGMGVDVADYENSGSAGIAITNFDHEMIALYRPGAGGVYSDVAPKTGIGQASRNSLGFGCVFFDADLDGRLDLLAANGHIDETVRNIRANIGYAQPPHLFMNQGAPGFRDAAREAGTDFSAPRVARGLAYGDFDRDGDVDVLMTTNHGPALLYRNDVMNGNRSIRIRLTGTKSNRDGIGAIVRVFTPDAVQSRMVKTGSSYLSQSELAVTFGVGKRDRVDRVVVEWPSGRVEEYKNLRTGAYECVEAVSMK